MSNRRAAFTLVEILVVAAIIAVLAALAVPALARIQAQGLASKCLSNLREIGVGINLYLNDHNQELPTLEAGRHSREEDVPVIDTVFAEYLKDPHVFACPADPKLARLTGTSYFWNPALNGQRLGSLNFLHLVDETSRIPILSDKEGWHRYSAKKVNILYADGHATRGLNF
jgi:prepilin-type N-terminal cleavage/methylation domain-containing protein/prepilin-type processing-associated H-X9-DG protein